MHAVYFYAGIANYNKLINYKHDTLYIKQTKLFTGILKKYIIYERDSYVDIHALCINQVIVIVSIALTKNL